MIPLAVLLAVLIGVALGVLGGGGSILTVPIFVYILGFEVKEAIAMSLAVVGGISLLGAVGHWRAGNVNVRVAGIFGVVAMAGTYLGARLAVFFSGAAQMAFFAAVMLLAAYFMFRTPPLLENAVAQKAAANKEMRFGLIVAEGMAVGVLTGLVGVGGGFLIVPALVVLGKLPMKQAVGTSLLVIAMKSTAGFAGYFGQVQVDWRFMALFAAVASAGILIGTYLVGLVPQHALQRAFAIFLVLMGGFILYENRVVVLGRSHAVPTSTTSANSKAAVAPVGQGPRSTGSTAIWRVQGGPIDPSFGRASQALGPTAGLPGGLPLE